MPIEKVAIVHKFGIISHSQRLQLEERLAKKSSVTAPSTYARTRKLAYEVSEDFVSKFNESDGDERLVLESIAAKMIVRSKRQAGIHDGGVGEHVDLPKAWTELGLLAQCHSSHVQEESLDLLIASLECSPPAVDQLPSLFYLAKSSLHWLKKSALGQPFLRTAELKLIKMGYLTFTRLYYHHLVQELKESQEEKESLSKYLEGVSEQQEVYSAFPGALLSMRYITQVGYLICAEDESLPSKHDLAADQAEDLDREVREGNDKQGQPEALAYNEVPLASVRESPSVVSSIHDVAPSLWHALDVWRSVTYRRTGLYYALEGLRQCGTGLAAESWLDVTCSFQVLVEASKQDLAVLETFQSLASGVLSKPAALSEMHARHVHVCYTCLSSLTGPQSAAERSSCKAPDRDGKSAASATAQSIGKTPSFVHDMRDFVDFGFESEPRERRKPSEHESEVTESVIGREDASSEASFADVSSVDSGLDGDGSGQPRRGVEQKRAVAAARRRRAGHQSSSDSDAEGEEGRRARGKPRSLMKKRDSQRRRSDRVGTGVRFDVDKTEGEASGNARAAPDPGGVGRMERTATKESLGSAVTHASSVSIPLPDEHSEVEAISRTDTTQCAELPGLRGWSWELACLYADSMTHLCLHGSTSAIQKAALLGNEATGHGAPHARTGTDLPPRALGLLSLLGLNFSDGAADSRREWSWRVRFAALQGLVRVCRHYHGNSTKDGLRTVAWNALMRQHSTERDVRVLEALKLAKPLLKPSRFAESLLLGIVPRMTSRLFLQVEADQENTICPRETGVASFPGWMAANLSAAMLPALPPTVPRAALTPRPRSRAASRAKVETTNRDPRQPSLRQEILLATATRERAMDYNTRMNLDLMSVVEAQWRKQLHEEEELGTSLEAAKTGERINEERARDERRRTGGQSPEAK